jgi:type II secretory pathway pseudopilin PulG
MLLINVLEKTPSETWFRGVSGVEKMSAGQKKRRWHAGFTLIEAVMASAIVLIMGLGLVAGLIFMRQAAEYDKQRIAAINYARQFMEQTRRDLIPSLDLPIQTISLDTFNTPSGLDDLHATAEIHIYEIDASGNRIKELTAPPTTRTLLEAEVIVAWNRTGSLSSRRVSESLRSYLVPESVP